MPTCISVYKQQESLNGGRIATTTKKNSVTHEGVSQRTELYVNMRTYSVEPLSVRGPLQMGHTWESKRDTIRVQL